MNRSAWKLAASVGLAAVIIVIAAVLIISQAGSSPGGELPDIDVPSVAPATPQPVHTPEPTPSPTPQPVPERVTFVGDSIMVAAKYEMYDLVPDCVIDAQVGRYLVEGIDALYRLDAAGKIYDTVVIGLGSNGPIEYEEGEEVMEILGPGRTVYWVTCYGRYLSWQDEVNDIIHELAEDYDNLSILDWSAVAPQHPEWISSGDGIHLTREGTKGYARFVAEGIGIAVPDEEE